MTCTHQLNVASFSALVALDVSALNSGDIAFVRGYFSNNDGGGGHFYWNPGSPAAPDIITSFVPNSITPPSAGRWRRIWFGEVHANWGGTATHAALAAADAVATTFGVPLVLDLGNYALTGDLTLNAPVVRFTKGAVITGDYDLTFNGEMQAGRYRVFNFGTGSAIFNKSKNSVGFPEWWGAVPGGPDCIAAINACIAAMHETNLAAADYYVSETVKLATSFKSIRGCGSQIIDTGSTTRLVLTSASGNALQLGPDSNPGAINYFPQDIVARDILVTRSTAPKIDSGGIGVLCQFTLYSRIENIRSAEHIIGFQFGGVVKMFVEKSYAFRSYAGVGEGADKYLGFHCDGTASIGAAGGNASLFLNYCNASLGGVTIANSTGFNGDAKFADVFLESPEVTNCSTGIMFTGDAANSINGGNTDLQIKNAIVDGFTTAGLYIKDANKYGQILISGGFYAPGSASATAGLYFKNSKSSIKVTGGSVPLHAYPTVRGILIDTCSGIEIDGTLISETETIACELGTSTNCKLTPRIQNQSVVNSGAAVQLDGNCDRNHVAPFVYGAASKYIIGVQLLGATNDYNEINCTGIDSATLGGSTNKLVINGSAVTTTGLSGNNLVSGVMT